MEFENVFLIFEWVQIHFSFLNGFKFKFEKHRTFKFHMLWNQYVEDVLFPTQGLWVVPMLLAGRSPVSIDATMHHDHACTTDADAEAIAIADAMHP